MIQRKVIIWSIIVALGGFIFGFDTVVISGGEQEIQHYWNLGSFAHGLTTSIAIIGTMLGALFGSIPADKIGRKKSLIFIGFIHRAGGQIDTAFPKRRHLRQER